MFLYVLILSMLLGVTMKVADLLDEHGLRWFKGSPVLFGLLWGTFGALLILANNTIANIMLAMNIAFLVRNRLDYMNHQLAAAIVLITFLAYATFKPQIFLVFFLWIVIFGFVDDYLDTVKTSRLVFELNRMLPYRLSTLVYSGVTGRWIVFASFLAFTVTYDVTKYIGEKHGVY